MKKNVRLKTLSHLHQKNPHFFKDGKNLTKWTSDRTGLGENYCRWNRGKFRICEISLKRATCRNFWVQMWATALRSHRLADLGVWRSLCKKICRENARLYFNSSAYSTATMVYERFSKAHLTVIMFSPKHRTELEGRKRDAFLQRITKILCHLISLFPGKEPLASRAHSPPALSLSPQKLQQQNPHPIS